MKTNRNQVRTFLSVTGRDRLRLAVALMLTIIMAVATALPFVFIGRAIDHASKGQSWALPLGSATALFILRPLLEKSRRRIAESISISVTNKVQYRILATVLKSNTTGLGPEESSVTILRSTEGVRRLVKLVATDAASVGVQVVVAIITAFVNNAHLAIIMVSTVPISLGLTALQIRSQHGIRVGLEEKRSKIGALLTELVGGTETLRATGAIDIEVARGQRNAEHLGRREVAHHQAMASWDLSKSFVQDASLIGVVLWGVLLLGRHQATLGTIAAAIALAQLVQQPLRDVHRVVDEGDQSIAQIKALLKLQQALPLPRYSNTAPPRHTKSQHKGTVRLENVSKTEMGPDGETTMLAKTSSLIADQEKIALVGENGSGKSTLLRLVSANLEPSSGKIEVDGFPIADLPDAAIRRTVSYLPQQRYFLEGTVRQNLLLGGHDDVPENLIRSVLGALDLDELVQRRGGLDGALLEKRGDGSWNFSGGQQARLALARVLLCQAPIMLLDEPDANLDPASLERVHAALASYNGTVIAATHADPTSWATRTVTLFKDASPSDAQLLDTLWTAL